MCQNAEKIKPKHKISEKCKLRKFQFPERKENYRKCLFPKFKKTNFEIAEISNDQIPENSILSNFQISENRKLPNFQIPENSKLMNFKIAER